MGFELIIIQALWLILPAYFANAFAVIVGGGTPIDFGKTYKDGKRILGNGKTWRGLFSGAFIGMTFGFGLVLLARYINASEYGFLELNTFLGFPLMIVIIFSLCFGALLGDIIESFFKRRIGKDRGQDWYGFDQLDFICGALLLSFLISSLLHTTGVTQENWFMASITPGHLLVILVFTPFFHLFSNLVLKQVKKRRKTST